MTWLINLLSFLPFLVVAFLVQWTERYDELRWVVYGLLLLFAAAVAVMGLMGVFLPEEQLLPLGLDVGDMASFGRILLITAALSMVVLLPQVRSGLARLIPIDAESAIDATALSLAVLAVGLVFSQIPLLGGLDGVAASDTSFGFMDLISSNLPIGLFPLIGVGLFIRRKPREVWQRLGLERLTWKQVLWVLGLTLAVLMAYYGLDHLWLATDPEGYERIGSVMDVLYGGTMTFWQAFLLSISAAVTEELFFRGALQPRFGLWLTALMFAGIHIQYGFTYAALEVLIAGLLLGVLRKKANTTACMLMHFLYNLVSFVVFPYLP